MDRRAWALRRLALETRTVRVTLRSAIGDLAAAEMDDAERAAQRREWRDRAAVLLQDVRARLLQLDAGRGSDGVVDVDLEPVLRELDAAEADLADLVDERSA